MNARFAFLAAFAVSILAGSSAPAQTVLQAPSIKWGGQWTSPTPVSTISTDTNTGLPCIAGSSATCPLASSGGGGGGTAGTVASTTALASNLVLKASAGTLYSFEVQADPTLAAAAWYVMIENATSAAANGAVTPAKCFAIPAGSNQMGGTYASAGIALTTGIVISVSTTGCFTKTASAHPYISGDYQ